MKIRDISSIDQLQTIMIFGVGSLFLYLVVPVALFANEVRLGQQSDDTSGTAAIFNSIFQSFFFIIAWSVFVSIIVFVLMKFGGTGFTNPAVGIDRYWSPDWIDFNETKRIIAHFSTTDEAKRDKAKFIVFIVTGAKALEFLLLGIFLALALKLSMSLPLLKMRRADHYKMTSQIDVGMMMSMFMTGILGWVIFTAIVNFEGLLLTTLVKKGAETANTTSNIVIPVTTNEPNIKLLDSLKKLLQLGADKIK